MTKFLKLTLVLIATTSAGFVSCSKQTAVVNPVVKDTVATELISGTWRISAFTQGTEDKTSKFSNIDFIFSKGGAITANDDGKQTMGSWHFTPAVTYYGSSSKDAISLSIGSSKPYDLLTKTWNLISHSSSVIKLDNPEVPEDEHVEFTKR